MLAAADLSFPFIKHLFQMVVVGLPWPQNGPREFHFTPFSDNVVKDFSVIFAFKCLIEFTMKPRVLEFPLREGF